MRDSKKRLSKATKKLMSEVIVTPLIPIKYKTYNNQTGSHSEWAEVFCDGKDIYETQRHISVAKAADPFMFYTFLEPLQNYITKITGDSYITLYDYRKGCDFKPMLNRKHPWMKGLK